MFSVHHLIFILLLLPSLRSSRYSLVCIIYSNIMNICSPFFAVGIMNNGTNSVTTATRISIVIVIVVLSVILVTHAVMIVSIIVHVRIIIVLIFVNIATYCYYSLYRFLISKIGIYSNY